jgi:hypothetical protein
MMNTGAKPAWAGRDLRLDPLRLPQAVSYASADDRGDVQFTISERGAVIRRILRESGLPVSIALPSRAFLGVAARAIEDGEGEVTVTLELHHADPQLCVPLLVAHDLDDVAADWRGWSRSLSIPMLMLEADGRTTIMEEMLGDIAVQEPLARPAARLTRNRRPRFLARRKQGGLGCRMVLDGTEIIARR